MNYLCNTYRVAPIEDDDKTPGFFGKEILAVSYEYHAEAAGLNDRNEWGVLNPETQADQWEPKETHPHQRSTHSHQRGMHSQQQRILSLAQASSPSPGLVWAKIAWAEDSRERLRRPAVSSGFPGTRPDGVGGVGGAGRG